MTNIDIYNSNPKLCPHCNIVIPYNKRFNKFCSRSCAAKFHLTFSDEEIDAKLLDRKIKRLNNYENIHLPLNWECLVCKYIWEATTDNILSKNCGCPRCSGKVLSNEVIDDRIINTDIKRIDDYINSHTKINWQCLKCNHIWMAAPTYISNLKNGCPKCNLPGYNAKLMHKLLEISGIEYEAEYSIRNINKDFPAYRIDAYFPLQKIAIEYNGKQHYEPTRFGSHYTEKDFEKQIARDDYIRSVCKTYNINLIEIDGRKFYGEKLKKYLTEEVFNILNKGDDQVSIV